MEIVILVLAVIGVTYLWVDARNDLERKTFEAEDKERISNNRKADVNKINAMSDADKRDSLSK